MPHSPMAVANEFIRRAGAGVLTQMQLQKLTFIANGWNLAVNGDPLISDFAQAWDYGPVYPDLYQHLKFHGNQRIGSEIKPSDADTYKFFGRSPAREDPFHEKMSLDEVAVIDRVWQQYGRLSGPALSNMTHKPGTPWFKTFFGSGGKNGIIFNDDIRQHYLELARAGR